jgi:hypothetical protein
MRILFASDYLVISSILHLCELCVSRFDLISHLLYIQKLSLLCMSQMHLALMTAVMKNLMLLVISMDIVVGTQKQSTSPTVTYGRLLCCFVSRKITELGRRTAVKCSFQFSSELPVIIDKVNKVLCAMKNLENMYCTVDHLMLVSRLCDIEIVYKQKNCNAYVFQYMF